MKIAIIGSGNVGKALAKSSVKAGHNVTMTATSAEKAAEVAKATGAHSAGSNQEAIKDADLVIVAVPYDKLGEVFRGLGTAVDGKVVVDATNHINTQDPGEVLNGISNAEEIQKRHPNVHVVKAFNYSFAARMAEPSVGGTRLDGFVAGDEAVQAGATDRWLGHPGGKGVVERLDDMHIGVALLDLLGVGNAIENFARVLRIDVVGRVHHDLAVHRGSESSEHLAELVIWNRDDHEVGVLDRLLVGAGRVGAGRLCHLGSLLRAGGGHRDVVSSLHARFGERLTDVPRADDRNLHVSISLRTNNHRRLLIR